MAKKKAVKKTAVKKGSAEAKRKMAKVRKAKKNYVVYEKDRQTKVKTTNSGGYLYDYNKKKDGSKQAMPPGKRISKKTGNPYYEYRINRTDVTKGQPRGKMFGVEKHYDTNSHNYNFTISGINGVINKGKTALLNNLRYLYGKYASDLISAKTLKDKRYIKKLMLETKKQINKLK